MQDHLLVRQEGQIAWVTLNRPARLNALDGALIADLRAFFGGLYRRRDVRVVVLSGAGRGFCAGLDIQVDRSKDTDPVGKLLDDQREIADIVLAMRRCPQPIIALVQGVASGGGMALALGADVRLATAQARFNAAFVRVGLSGCDIGLSYFLPRMIGASAAAEFLLTGRFIEAERARELGLISRIVEAAELEGEGLRLAEDMLATSPLGLRLTKEALNYSIDAPSLDAVVAMEDRNQILCVKDGAFAEAIEAFRKRSAG